MYRYDEFDHALVSERIAEFTDQVRRRVDGRLTEDQFKPLRLMNGVYLQLHAYMLRVAVPYGTMNSAQLKKLGHIARVYDKGYGHFTTRTNIQYNWPALSDLPAILTELAEVEMHAIQTSGNCIRNVTTDVFAGRHGRGDRGPAPVVRDHPAMVDHPPGVLVPAAQVQDRRHRAPRPTAPPSAPTTWACRSCGATRRRDRLPRLRGRRPGAPALHRPGDRARRAGARAAGLPDRHPARLQSAGPARQHPQGAHQDPGGRPGHRGLPRGGGAPVRDPAPRRPAHLPTTSWPASRPISPRRRSRPCRSTPARSTGPCWPIPTSPAGAATTSAATARPATPAPSSRSSPWAACPAT